MADCLYVAIAKLIILGTFLSYTWADQACKPTNSAMTCIKKSGRFLDPDPDTEINIIHFIECNLSALTDEDFSKFSNVHIISIFNSTLLFPAQGRLFSGLQDLHELKISDSDVTEQVGIAFAENKNILKVTLTGNKISSITKNLFSHLKLVEEIDLSNNQIIQIEPGVFEGLSSLRFLNLSSNQIGKIDVNSNFRFKFDPSFLILASSKCAVCRETTSAPECTFDDLNRCEESKAFDQLWWMSISVSLHIEKNPICSLAMEKVNTSATITDGIPLNKSKDKERCKVYEKGHCFKHESRRMFLLEACGFKRIPSQIGDKEDAKIVQPEIELPNNTVSFKHQNEVPQIIGIAGLSVIQIVTILLVLTAIIGALITYYIKVTNKKKKRNEFSTKNAEKSTTSDNVTVRVPLMDNEHAHQDKVNDDNRLHGAIVEDNLKRVKDLLASGVNPNSQDEKGELPIHYAARVGNDKIIEELWKYSANINAFNRNDQAAIHFAVGRGNLFTVKCLLSNDSNINVKNKDGNTPLSLAVKDGHIEIAGFLISNGADVNATNNFQQLPIHFAARNGHTEVLKLLISKGSEYGPRDDRGYTPLHYAARRGYVEIAKILLEKGENVDVRNSSQNTPLHKAAKGGQMKMIEFLLEKNADVQATNFKGQMPHTIARLQQHDKCDELLQQRLKQILNQSGRRR